MKFLHTSDLHLGKVFHEHSLIDDQTFILDKLLTELRDESFQALVIAGDVYDRSVPSPDAVKLFSSFLGKLKRARPDLEVFLISGNHDSSSRLSFGRELFAELGVFFTTDPIDADKPIVIGEGGDRVAFFLLPFLNPGSLESQGGDPLRLQARLVETAAERLEKARLTALEKGARRAVLVAHLFAAGGLTSDSERSFLGNAELADVGLFAGFDYVALGHLHRCQPVGTNAYYSGSPLAYSFSEAKHEKFFLSVMLSDERPIVEKILVEPLRRTSSITGAFEDFQGDLSDEVKAKKNHYLEIILTDKGFIDNPLFFLRQRFPYLLKIGQDEAVKVHLQESCSRFRFAAPDVKRSIVDDFADFLLDVHGGINDEEIALFQTLLAREAG
ncbi:MAG: exonuclease subunit SbcD [Treponema sp.]|jgi:exonuclease SbcD|nr:exonuclease subunit SbcD [Treponema sp.]